MRVDYHTHHSRCGHATGRMDDYVEAAIAAGLHEIGLSDHSPIYHLGDDPHARPNTAMSQHELPQYVQEGKSYLTIALGCTGGRHRSVAIAEELGQRITGWGYTVHLRHRDLHR